MNLTNISKSLSVVLRKKNKASKKGARLQRQANLFAVQDSYIFFNT